eukprot:4374837-Prymnesium_polylepis.1
MPARIGARLQAVRAHAWPPTPAGCPRARAFCEQGGARLISRYVGPRPADLRAPCTENKNT